MSRSRIPGDPDQLPIEELETIHGPRTATATGDRLMIGLAVAALLGGVLIAVSNVLPDTPGVTQASPKEEATATPRPTRTPRPTPTPRPLREIALEQLDPPDTAGFDAPFATWIRARVDLAVHANRDEDSAQLDVLPAGEVAYAEGRSGSDPGWLAVNGGWVQVEVDGEVLVDGLDASPGGPYPSHGGEIYQLTTDGERVMALGWSQIGSFGGEAFAAVTEDGRTWRRTQAPISRWTSWLVTFGPTGWMLATGSVDGDGVHLWHSEDASRWESLGRLRDAGRQGPNIGWPEQLMASDLGYLLATTSPTSSGPGLTYWYSPDGRTWLETGSRQLDDAYERVAATDLGFYAWRAEEPVQGPASEPVGSFMVDGRTWRPVDVGPSGFAAHVAGVADHLLGIDVQSDRATARVWIGRVEGSNLSWARDDRAEALLEEVGVLSLSSDGRQAVVTGIDRRTGQAVVYLTDGSEWTDLRPPPADDGGEIISTATMGPDGPILVGHRYTLRGDFPVLWWPAPGGRWLAETDPLIPEPPPVAADECPPAPDDAFEFVTLDTALAVECFPGSDLTFQAWVNACPDCEMGDQGFEPPWLAPSSERSLYILPIDSDIGGPTYSATLHPDAVVTGELNGTWAELTGHFADPAAQGCRVQAPPGQAEFYPSDRSLIFMCLRTFVVTEARALDAPEGG